MERLLEIMRCLRSPEGGCPWDRAQSFETISPYTLEEAYEVDDAIRRGDMADLRDELGDLLFQVVFHAQMASEAGEFAFDDVVEAICEKLTRRHPHVFGDAPVESHETLGRAWEEAKAKERAERAAERGDEAPDPFSGIPGALPALARSSKIQKRAASLSEAGSAAAQGNLTPVRVRLEARLRQLVDEAAADEPTSRARLGELLFELVGLSRRLGVDPEGALREANDAFERDVKRGAPC